MSFWNTVQFLFLSLLIGCCISFVLILYSSFKNLKKQTSTMNLPTEFAGLKINQESDINILLLGETGVGKSTFINSLANYLHYKEFKKAKKGELLILIPSQITIRDVNFESHTLKVGSDLNEFQEVGASATQGVKTYVFPLLGGKTRLRLIDTPGMCDSQGIEQDEENCENILSYISQLHELHAICYLIQPTNSRITPAFEYCVKQILSRLEKSASKNFIFIFTNTRGSDYKPGETLPCLKKLIEEIKAHPPYVEIPLVYNTTVKNVFCFDNETFRFLVALKNDVKLEETQKKSCKESWENSSKECWKLISYIIGDGARDPLRPHQMKNTVCVNEARRVIMQLCQPLAEISQLIYDNICILDRHKQKLQYENQSLDELKSKMYMPVINLQVVKLTQPVTVCASIGCADVYKVGDKNKWHYRTRCHDPCYLTDVTKEFIGDPKLINCAAMNGNRYCSKCGCDFLNHMHVYYMTKTVEEKIEDDTIKKNIGHKQKVLEEIQRLVRQMDVRKKELEEERKCIINSTARFAHFLQNNAITPFNDAYRKYIHYLIVRERSLGRAADEGSIENLEKLLKQYEEIKEVFDKSLELSEKLGSGVVAQVTPQTIMTCIQDLYRLKHNGKKIKELYDKQKTARDTEYKKNCEYIHPKETCPDDEEVQKNDGKQKKDLAAKKRYSGSQRDGSRNFRDSRDHSRDPRGNLRNPRSEFRDNRNQPRDLPPPYDCTNYSSGYLTYPNANYYQNQQPYPYYPPHDSRYKLEIHVNPQNSSNMRQNPNPGNYGYPGYAQQAPPPHFTGHLYPPPQNFGPSPSYGQPYQPPANYGNRFPSHLNRPQQRFGSCKNDSGFSGQGPRKGFNKGGFKSNAAFNSNGRSKSNFRKQKKDKKSDSYDSSD